MKRRQLSDLLGSDIAEPQDQRMETSPADLLRPLLQGRELVKDFLVGESYTMFFELISYMTHLTTVLEDQIHKAKNYYFLHYS